MEPAMLFEQEQHHDTKVEGLGVYWQFLKIYIEEWYEKVYEIAKFHI